MYITKEEFEAYLGIQFEEGDTTPNTLISGVESAVNSYIGADGPNGILKTEYIEDIDLRSVIVNADGYNIYLKHGPIDKAQDIYINDMNTAIDYNTNPFLIQRGRQIIIKNLDVLHNNENPIDKRNWLRVKYTAGYGTYDEQTGKWSGIPDDIKQVCLFLCATIWLTRNFTGMTNYRLGDESLSIGKQRFIYDSPFVSETLKKYRKIYIAY